MDHILVPRAAIPAGQVLQFELFVKVNDRHIKVANKGEAVDPDRIARYLENSKDVLYIERGSLERFMDEKFGIMFEMIGDPNRTLEARIEWFIRCLELGFVDLKVVRPHADKFMRVELLVDWCYEHFRKRELRMFLLGKVFWGVDQVVTKRALLGATLGLTIFMEQNDCSALAFKSLFTGAIFRDISLNYMDAKADPHIPGVDGLFGERLAEYLSHPTDSVAMLEKFIKVDDAMRAIIEQHHELALGNGFPRKLKRSKTYQPAQYLNLADFTVTALEKYRAKGGTLTREATLDYLRAAMPEEDHKNLPVLLRILGPVFPS